MKAIRLFVSLLWLVGWLTACGTAQSELPQAEPAAANQPAITLSPEPVVTDSAATAVFTPQPTVAGPDLRRIEHDGISLAYDPALLGDVTIHDVPATADQGLFGLPTPAHTWFGFAPAGTVPEDRNHWNLLIEPQILFFSPNDFGSFAAGDAIARERIAAFQALAADRPTSFSGEVPILPLVNAAQAMQAQVKWLDFEGGSGVRFLTAHGQDVSPIANDRLTYIFYGQTSDGLHGITAVFRLSAAALPETAPNLSDAEYAALNKNYAAEMAAVTAQLNDLDDGDFNPPLSELDALVQSIAIVPAETDYAIADARPQNALVTAGTDILSAPGGGTSLGILAAGDAVVMNGASSDGRYSRIQCADGSTGNCWVSSDTLQLTDTSASQGSTTGSPVDGQIMQIQALVENVVFAAPDETAAPLGTLRVGEQAEVFTTDAGDGWYNIACPRHIGVNCWVISDTAVNEPTGFYSSDGWKPVSGEFAGFRVPVAWNVEEVPPFGGAVLEAWTLGIPGAESDQDVAFSAVPFEDLKPADVERETPIEIGGRAGVKWLRSGPGYVTYDYYTRSAASGAGSFGIHVTLPEADPDLEAILDGVAASVDFSTPDGELAAFEPRFDRYLPFAGQEGENSIIGLVQQNAGWQLVSIPYPEDTYATDSDYAPTTDRLLVWQSLDGVGPGSLASGPLSIIDLGTRTEQIVIPDSVVSAAWAPNGLDFAYILGTPDTYELRWRADSGEDRLLAVDVPHSLRVAPDGRHLAFTRESHYGLASAVPGLYVVEVETGRETQLSTLDRAGYGGLDRFWKPAWSPDSSQVLLYAAADNDRALAPHPSGYVWAAADGSFSHFLPESELLSFYDEPLSAPDNRPCLGGAPLFATDQLIVNLGQCRPMTAEPETAALLDFTLDEQSGAISSALTLLDPFAADFLAWDVPGKSLLWIQDEDVSALEIEISAN